MDKLSNSGLLDGDVVKNMTPKGNNPNRANRLQRTTRFAEKPEEAEAEAVVEESHNFADDAPAPKPVEVEEKPSTLQIDKYAAPYPEAKKEKKGDDDDKIFGLNKWLVVGLATTVVAIGGYFVYNKYFKNGAAAIEPAAPAAAAPAPAAAAPAPAAAPEVPIV